MYIPSTFQEPSVDVLHEMMRAYPFAALITERDSTLIATHLPFLIDPARGEYGTLRAHMARLNPQWQGFANEQEALVVFEGAHAYISPTWYKVHPAVPTWNYTVAHAYGIPRVVDDTALREILTTALEMYESPHSELTLPENYFDKMASGVVGFEIEITRLEGKFKLSQNRSAEDQRSVADALGKSARDLDRQVAELMMHSLNDTSAEP